MDQPILRFRDVGYRFSDGFWGLRRVNLDLHRGELLLLAGPNGAGKTLLMRHANGLARPTEGEVLYCGENPGKAAGKIRYRIGLVFQHPEEQIIEDSVAAEIAFGPENLGIRGDKLKSLVESNLELFGLTKLADRHPMSLSGGERRRLALASVLAMEPEILLLDEPFMELDYPGVQSLLSILLQLHAEGQGICIITHDVGKVLAHGDRVALMKNGTVSVSGKPAEIVDQLEEHGVRNPCRGDIPLEQATWR
jgi:biotin transport system ATP-binding protein